MKRMMLLVLCGLAVPAIAARTQPVYEPEIFVDGNPSADQVAKIIKKALAGRTWAVKGKEKGVINAQIWVRSHSAKIKVLYTRKKITIKYVASENLAEKRKGDTVFIHRNYNRWIKNLESDIGREIFSL